MPYRLWRHRPFEQKQSWPVLAPTGDGFVVVLVVEDEDMIREFVAEDLQEAGYQVMTASNADAAVDILQTRQDIRLVFTDVNMPGTMNGLQLAACVRDKWPRTHIVVTSGKYWPADKLAGAVFVPKPYAGSAIIDIINSFPGMRGRPAARDTRPEALPAQAFQVARSK